MDDTQCGENIKAWGCTIIIYGAKGTNFKLWANKKIKSVVSRVFSSKK